MKILSAKRLVVFCLVVGLVLLFHLPTAKSKPTKKMPEYVPGRVLVKFVPGTNGDIKSREQNGLKAKYKKRIPLIDVEIWEVPPGISVEEAVDHLNKNPNVLFAEPDHYATPQGTITPLDPQFGRQWYLDKGLISDVMGSIDVDIDAPEGWAILSSLEASIGATLQSTVAVVDSGCGDAVYASTDNAVGYSPNHPDIFNSLLYANNLEIGATADSDDDTNGFKDDYNGWNFAENNNLPAGTNFHGTFICGIVGAAWNDTGTAGIGRDYLNILPLKTNFEISSIAAAIIYAVERKVQGAKIASINLSLGTTGDDSTLREAIQQAESESIMVYAAAGNDDKFQWYDNDLRPLYPASYSTVLSNVIGVASADSTGNISFFSHFGKRSVQVSAPGEFIYSTALHQDNWWVYAQGTSFATPVVAAVGALVSAADTTLSISQIKNRLKLGGNFDETLTELTTWERRVNLAGTLAPFYPFSGLAPLYSTQPLFMYTDNLGQLYGSIAGAISSDSTVAVMVTDSSGNWYVEPNKPGIVSFGLSFTAPGPVSVYRTGMWRVTGINPFSETVYIGETLDFENNTGTSGTWFVEDPAVGDIEPVTGRFTALSLGVTYVYLMSSGTRIDQSGNIVVKERPISSNSGGGGCGIMSLPGDPYIPGLVEMVLVGTLLFMLRRRWLAMRSPMSKAQSPKR